jgi:hypothetical protein
MYKAEVVPSPNIVAPPFRGDENASMLSAYEASPSEVCLEPEETGATTGRHPATGTADDATIMHTHR